VDFLGDTRPFKTYGRPHPGKLWSAAGVGIVRVEERLDTGIDELWSALTDIQRLARWYGMVEGDLRAGGRFRACVHASGWEGTGRVEECEPPAAFPGPVESRPAYRDLAAKVG
jgi:activator of Hsp90 ATPase-like protein